MGPALRRPRRHGRLHRLELAPSLGLGLLNADRVDVLLYAFGTNFAKGTIEWRHVQGGGRLPYPVRRLQSPPVGWAR